MWLLERRLLKYQIKHKLSFQQDDANEHCPAVGTLLKQRPSTATVQKVAATLLVADSILQLIVTENVTMSVNLSIIRGRSDRHIDLVQVLIWATVYP